jgi:diguanylate cyclase (GGDEF)-like protein/PAS domain S-box-containing protein
VRRLAAIVVILKLPLHRPKTGHEPFAEPLDMKRWRARFRVALGSLKLRVFAGSLAALTLGIGVITALLVQQADRETMAAQMQRELSATVRTADILAQRVVAMQRALQSVAVQLDADTLADDARLDAFIEGKPVLRGMFSNVYAATAEGQMRVFADSAGIRRVKLNLADRAYFQRTLAELRPLISEPLPGRVSGEPVIVFTYPLRNAKGVYGVVGGALRLQSRDLIDTLIGTSDAQHDGLVVVTDATGKILAHPDRRLLSQSLAKEPRLAQAFAQWQASGGPVEPAGLPLADALGLVNAAGVPGPDWMVWQQLPTDLVLGPVHAARSDALAWAAGLVVAMSLLLWGLLWWLLRPLTQLELRAQDLFNDEVDPQLGWPRSGGEIGRVSRVLRQVGADRARAEAINTEVLKKLGSVMSAAPVGIAFTRARHFELVSAEFCRLLGYPDGELLGRAAVSIFASHKAYEALGPQVAEAFGAGRSYEGEQLMRRADGSEFWGALRARPVDAQDVESGTIWTLNDIGEQVAARDLLNWNVTHDVLTGVGNRRCFEQALHRVFATRPQPAALVMLDLDHFKPINDTAGHAMGDAMLVAVARAISTCVRASDLVVRLGGDEFAVLLEKCEIDVAMRIAEQVRVAVSAIALPWQGQALSVGASLGVAALTAEMPDAAGWALQADAACYAAKAEGRNAVRQATLQDAALQEAAFQEAMLPPEARAA